MKNRSRMEILYDIVSAAKSPVRKTNLMYKSNLSFKQLELYLDFLMQQGLIEVKPETDGPGDIYGTTLKGFQFTNIFEDLQSYLTLPNVPRPLSISEARLSEAPVEQISAPEMPIG